MAGKARETGLDDTRNPAQAADWLERLRASANADAALVHRGRFVDAVVLFDTGASQHLLDIRRGRIEALAHGPFVMPRWDLALRAPLAEWLAFWEAMPAPGHHDLMALIKRRVLRVEGDLHPFMANLLFFKALMAAPRARPAVRSTALSTAPSTALPEAS